MMVWMKRNPRLEINYGHRAIVGPIDKIEEYNNHIHLERVTELVKDVQKTNKSDKSASNN